MRIPKLYLTANWHSLLLAKLWETYENLVVYKYGIDRVASSQSEISS